MGGRENEVRQCLCSVLVYRADFCHSRFAPVPPWSTGIRSHRESSGGAAVEKGTTASWQVVVLKGGMVQNGEAERGMACPCGGLSWCAETRASCTVAAPSARSEARALATAGEIFPSIQAVSQKHAHVGAGCGQNT